MESPLEQTVTITRALAHPARLRVLAVLRTGELCVCQIIEILDLAPSTVSAHLRELRRAGLTIERKQGRWVYVALAEDGHPSSWIQRTFEDLDGDDRIAADVELATELRRLPVEVLCRFGLEAARSRVPGQQQKETHHDCA